MIATRVIVLKLGIWCLAINAYPCCGIMSEQEGELRFGSQSNIVAWDPNTQIEHFVRSASFTTSAKKFDFIAPTPSVPEICAVKSHAFDVLRSLTRTSNPFAKGGGGGAFGGGGASVEVIKETTLGNLKATTLRANDVTALKDWLAANKYQMSPTQDEWLGFYIKKDWYLTAFRVESKDSTIVTEAIRMSFKTPQPYNPYYVPKENWSKNAKLDLFFIVPVEMKGYIGKTPWQARVESQTTLDEKSIGTLIEDLSLQRSDFPMRCTLTKYVDFDFAKGVKEDLFFRRV